MSARSPSRVAFVVALTCPLLMPPSAQAQRSMGAYEDVRELPNTPAAKRLTEIIDLINANDPARTRSYIEGNFTEEFRNFAPMDQHLAVFKQVHDTTGGMTFYSIRKYEKPRSPDELVGIARTRLTESWRGIVISVEAKPPHHIAGLNFAPARPPSNLPDAGPLSEAELVSELRSFLTDAASKDLFSGTVLLARGDKVLLREAYGVASKRFDVPNHTDTKFNIGSMNKMFTAVAIAQLQERGKLDWDDPIAKYLDKDWLDPKAAGKITIRHLLTHTSGLGSYFTDEFFNSARFRYRTMDDYQTLVNQDKPAFEPGTDWSYSNTGFLLLGVIIQKITGQTYYNYVRENICKPAGMTDTDCYDMDHPVPNLAIGYSRQENEDGTRWRNNLFIHAIKGGSAGGGFSTVDDLYRFAQAMRQNRLVSAETAKVMWNPTPGTPQAAADYGFGFGISGTPDDRVVGHSGGFPGIGARLAIHLNSGYTIAILTNIDGGLPVAENKIVELMSRLEKMAPVSNK